MKEGFLYRLEARSECSVTLPRANAGFEEKLFISFRSADRLQRHAAAGRSECSVTLPRANAGIEGRLFVRNSVQREPARGSPTIPRI